ncbi:Hypothetical predicted protein [Olea europaea subsp. europaea]|uniref:Uncharacterized protein n=1 Tax=Olea europaea subsp. europaea TaxID=158383 RepID=A0A8S0P989_OLEEU|nr:Hypothetical predicted protein [Olea europaea subsp. europaea]
MDLSYRNLSIVVTSSGLLPHLQDLEVDGGEKIVSFQWLGPHFLAILKYARRLYTARFLRYYYDPAIRSIPQSNNRFCELLELLDDSACASILHGETEDYENFLEIIISFMPELKNFFTMQNLLHLLQFPDSSTSSTFYLKGIFTGTLILDTWANSIEFLIEKLEILLRCRRHSNVLVSNHQVNVLLKELKFLFTVIVDKEYKGVEELGMVILTEIDAVFIEAGLFLHSFFFTTNIVTAKEMDLAVFVLLERIEIVKVKIKDHWLAVSTKLNLGIGSLQVEESPIEVSSS